LSWTPERTDHTSDASPATGLIMGAPNEGPVRGWEVYEAEEAARILARYPIGRIRRAEEYRRGSRSAPKLKIRADEGLFLLKRRSTQRHPVGRIRFSHALQGLLMARGVPVAPLVASADGVTLVVEEPFAYELFRFIEGDRFDKTPQGAARAGEALAILHRHARDADCTGAVAASFHASAAVRSALDRLPASVLRADSEVDAETIAGLAQALQALYERAVEEIDDGGFGRLPRAVVHGDWHPGNLIFRGGEVAAVIDFDSARVEPRITELANAMLQFALRGEPGVSPLQWPDDLDPKRMQALLHGFLVATDQPISLDERAMIPWCMIEAMISESAIPVANQGSFAELPGAAFLDLVRRKCDWVRSHRKAIAAL
jgi:homoserine kinase type II